MQCFTLSKDLEVERGVCTNVSRRQKEFRWLLVADSQLYDSQRRNVTFMILEGQQVNKVFWITWYI